MFATLLLAAACSRSSARSTRSGGSCAGSCRAPGCWSRRSGSPACCAWVLAAVMLAVLVALLDLELEPDARVAGRAGLRGAPRSRRSGVAIGGLTREVRAASLLAFMLALPIAALALVPSGAVGGTLYDVIRVVSGAFPFKPALDALDAALNGGGLLGAARAPRRADARLRA